MMERPIKYRYANKVALLEYNQLLEEYCDKLEIALAKIRECYKDVEASDYQRRLENEKLKKAFDKLCKEIVNLKEAADCYEYEQCPFRKECSSDCYHVKAWADWAMREE